VVAVADKKGRSGRPKGQTRPKPKSLMTADDLARASARERRYWPLFMRLSPRLTALFPQPVVDAVDARERAIDDRERAREAEWAFKMLAPLLVPSFQECGDADAQQISDEDIREMFYEAVLQVPFLKKDAPNVRGAVNERLGLPTPREEDEVIRRDLSVFLFAPSILEAAERLWGKEAERMRKQGKLLEKTTGTEYYDIALENLAKILGKTGGYLERRMQQHFKDLGLKLERKPCPPDLEEKKWFDEWDAHCEQCLKVLRVAKRANSFYVERLDPVADARVEQSYGPFRMEEVAKCFMRGLAEADAAERMPYPACVLPKFPPDDLKAYEEQAEREMKHFAT